MRWLPQTFKICARTKKGQAHSSLKYDEAQYRRNLDLIGKAAVSRSDLDKSLAARDVDIANIAADQAVVASRQLDLEYTKVLRRRPRR